MKASLLALLLTLGPAPGPEGSESSADGGDPDALGSRSRGGTESGALELGLGGSLLAVGGALVATGARLWLTNQSRRPEVRMGRATAAAPGILQGNAARAMGRSRCECARYLQVEEGPWPQAW